MCYVMLMLSSLLTAIGICLTNLFFSDISPGYAASAKKNL